MRYRNACNLGPCLRRGDVVLYTNSFRAPDFITAAFLSNTHMLTAFYVTYQPVTVSRPLRCIRAAYHRRSVIFCPETYQKSSQPA